MHSQSQICEWYGSTPFGTVLVIFIIRLLFKESDIAPYESVLVDSGPISRGDKLEGAVVIQVRSIIPEVL